MTEPIERHQPREIEPVGDLIAFDPGVDHPACALFRSGVLRCAERVRVDAPPDLPQVDRCVRVAIAAARWAIALDANPRYLIVEWPQVYTRGKSKGDPNDLLLLAGIDAAFAAIMSAAVSARDVALVLRSPKPAEWAGQLPKTTKGNPWDSVRARRIRSRLSEEELLNVESSHDAIDAVGIGLHALGRFERHVVFDGVTPDLDPNVS